MKQQKGFGVRIVYIDIDTLRPDHLGCYGYHRNTSPHMDALAGHGVRFENCYVSDSPCLPSRAAFYSGQPVGSPHAVLRARVLRQSLRTRAAARLDDRGCR